MIESYSRGSAVVIGVTVKNKLGVQTNPTNGVSVTSILRKGAAPVSGAVTDAACTQGQYDEDNDTATGQYSYTWQSATTDLPGRYVATLTIDPSGTYQGIETVEFNLT